MAVHLVDLEAQFTPAAERSYDPAALVVYAFTVSDYWAGLGLAWLEQGLSPGSVAAPLLALEANRSRSQSIRHRARRLRMRTTQEARSGGQSIHGEPPVGFEPTTVRLQGERSTN